MGRKPYQPKLRITVSFIEDEEAAREAIIKAISIVLASSSLCDEEV